MRWFRSNRFEIVGLAFFALTCQFALTLGHVHPVRTPSPSIGWAKADGPGKAVAVEAGKLGGRVPTAPGQHPGGIGEDFCAICATVSLASALIVPVGPGPLTENHAFEAVHWVVATSEGRPIHLNWFNARGPPAVLQIA